MIRMSSLFLMLLFFWPSGHESVPAPATLRVLTYNIRHGEGTDGFIDLERIAAIVKGVDPDLVALQEVDERTTRTGSVNQLAELERLTGLHGTFGKAMNYLGGGYGVAVLSRWPALGVYNQPLPTSEDREPRTALTIRVRAGSDGPLLHFTSTHLDQGREEESRLAQAARLSELEGPDHLPAILAGDMNSRSGTNAMTILEARWTNALAGDPTAPDGRPRRGDYVLFQPADSWRVVETRVLDERIASDHRPVLVVLEWTERR